MSMPTLAEEIRRYVERDVPPDFETLARWAKRAEALAQVRDELLRAAPKAGGYRVVIKATLTLSVSNDLSRVISAALNEAGQVKEVKCSWHPQSR